MKNIKTYEKFGSRTFKEYLHTNQYHPDADVISCSRTNIDDLYGIDKFVNLVAIHSGHNNLTNLLDLKDSKKLSYLDVTYNNITSLKGIENLTKLDHLYCYNNELTSLDFLPNNLVTLSCYENYFTSLKGIENLINLKELYIHYTNIISSLKGVEGLTKLEILSCEKTPIDWVDYIDNQGRTYYTKLPKSITTLNSDKFENINEYWEFMEKNQPSGISHKFNF